MPLEIAGDLFGRETTTSVDAVGQHDDGTPLQDDGRAGPGAGDHTRDGIRQPPSIMKSLTTRNIEVITARV